MSLGLQVLGVLAAGVVLARVLGARSSAGRFPVAGAALAAALLAGALFFYHVYRTGSGLPGLTTADSAVSSLEAQSAADPRANNTFLAWARDEMLANAAHRRGTYYLEPPAALQDAELGQWSTYTLLPERATTKLSEADWIVFYGVNPALTGEQSRHFGGVTEFSPGFALAVRSNGH